MKITITKSEAKGVQIFVEGNMYEAQRELLGTTSENGTGLFDKSSHNITFYKDEATETFSVNPLESMNSVSEMKEEIEARVEYIQEWVKKVTMEESITFNL